MSLGDFIQSPSRVFAAGCGAGLVGVGIHAFFEWPWLPGVVWFVASAIIFTAFVALWRRPPVRLISGCLLMMTMGLWRYDLALTPPPTDAWPTRTETFSGQIVAEPTSGISGTVLVLATVKIDGDDQPLVGRFRLTVSAPMDFLYGQTVRWKCRPRPVVVDSTASVELLWRGYDAACLVREATIDSTKSIAPSWRGALYATKRHLTEIVGEYLPEPESSLLLGLLIGDRSGLPEELRQAFRQTGTSHILAVSGYNISQVIGIIMIMLAGATVRPRAAAIAAAVGVAGFAVLVGGEASVVRAALMGGLSLLALLWRRRYSGTIALLAIAWLMLLLNPLTLRHDIGFQLSFAAVWGLSALGPPLGKRLIFLPTILNIRQTLADSLAATVATLPIVVLQFGALPLLGPLINVLVLPLVPRAMFLGAVALLGAAIAPPLAWPGAIAAYVLLHGIIVIVVWSSRWLPAPLLLSIGPVAAVFIAAGVLLLAWRLNRPPPDELAPIGPPLAPNDIQVEIIDCRHEK